MSTYPIEKKLVIAVSSSALFDLTESDKVFREQGEKVYKQFQKEHLDIPLKKGVAFPFIRRFLAINNKFPEERPVEVVLLSRNSTTTGRRVFRSIKHHGLDITRAAFLSGSSPFPYIPGFNASLFLSANEGDVKLAINKNFPAGIVLPSKVNDNMEDVELRVAFDFDGVIADDEAETIYKKGGLEKFQQHEQDKIATPHNNGLLAKLFTGLSNLQALEEQAKDKDPNYKTILRTAIITARNAPAHERMVTTLESWGVSANETFFLGGMDKNRILGIFKPHIFFDDQKHHLTATDDNIPMVHIPFGVANKGDGK
ncbi:MAG: 5'-nucleotidase [Marinagarivorans sp.]|nr:5'-nucleotidase [Marinagarivorans sp.]